MTGVIWMCTDNIYFAQKHPYPNKSAHELGNRFYNLGIVTIPVLMRFTRSITCPLYDLINKGMVTVEEGLMTHS